MTMRCRGMVTLLSFLGFISPAAAQVEFDIPPLFGYNLTLQDYLFLFLVLVILLNILIFLRKGIFPAPVQKEPSGIVTVIGSFMATLFVGIGSFAAFAALLGLLSIPLEIAWLEWPADTLVYNTGSLWLGIVGLGIVGMGMFLLGTYNLVLLQNTSWWKSLREPDTAGMPLKSGMEDRYWSPHLVLKILDKETNAPAANVHVFIRGTNGTKYFSRFTNTEEEVTFDSIPGHLADFLCVCRRG